MGNRLDINPGERHKDWLVIKEVEKREPHRYFLCECLICHNEYEIILYNLINENKCFCCSSCAASKRFADKADELIGKTFGRLTVINRHSVTKSGHWKYNCSCSCGNEKVITGSALKNRRTTSCGCYLKESVSERFSGEGNPSWIDGRTPQNHLDRTKIQKSINPIIRERDNDTCQNCGQHKGWLNVHHIYDFSTYHELKFEESNLITLCKTCHDDFHKIYSKFESNTLANLESWLDRDYLYRNVLLEVYNHRYPVTVIL